MKSPINGLYQHVHKNILPFTIVCAKIHKKIFLDFVIFLIFTISLCLRIFIPPNLVMNSPHDDLLGVTLAHSLLQGDWLGDWDNRTLVKPPLYSLFLASIHFTGLSPTIIVHFLYLLVSLLAIKTLLRFFSNWSERSQSLAARFGFFYLAFNPAVLGADFSKIHRISLNTVLAFLFVILFIRFIFSLHAQIQGKLSDKYIISTARTPRALSAIAISLGLIYSALVLTRSEAMWLLYPAIATILFLLIYTLRVSANKSKKFNVAKLAATVILLSVVSFMIPVTFISSMNEKYYGVFLTEDYFAGEFERAITLWEGVRNGADDRTFISVSRGQREAVYNISPAAKELEPFLETPANTGWKSANCSTTNVCDESGAWFTWELRDAATSAKDLKSGRDFQLFFKSLADEISIGCSSKQIECGTPGFASGVKPLDQIPLHQFIDFTFRAILTLLDFDAASNVGRGDPGGSLAQEQVWKSTVNYQVVVTNSNFEQWKTLGTTVTALKRVYIALTLVLFVLFIAVLLGANGAKARIEDMLAFFFLLFSIALFLFGIGLLDVNAGFSTAFSLYTLPVQPIFLFFMLFSTFFAANSVMRLRSISAP